VLYVFVFQSDIKTQTERTVPLVCFGLRKNIRVICEICGFKAKLQIFTNYLWAKWPVSQ